MHHISMLINFTGTLPPPDHSVRRNQLSLHPLTSCSHGTAACSRSTAAAAMDEDAIIDGLTEDDLIDDAEVDTMVREAISSALGDAQFLHSKIDTWSANIVEGCLKRLAALNKPFKYVLTCNLTQKTGAGLHTASCTRWGGKTDGKLTVQWENKSMMVLVTAFWLAI